MPNINIERQHSLSLKNAKAAVDEVAVKIAEKFQMATEWDGDQLKFSRKGVEGKILVSQEHVKVDAELSFMVGLIKGTIEKEINGYLDKVLV